MTDAGETKSTKVLIIDDDQKLCRLVADYLGPMGYKVSAAFTGPDGLEKASSGEFGRCHFGCDASGNGWFLNCFGIFGACPMFRC